MCVFVDDVVRKKQEQCRIVYNGTKNIVLNAEHQEHCVQLKGIVIKIEHQLLCLQHKVNLRVPKTRSGKTSKNLCLSQSIVSPTHFVLSRPTFPGKVRIQILMSSHHCINPDDLRKSANHDKDFQHHCNTQDGLSLMPCPVREVKGRPT